MSIIGVYMDIINNKHNSVYRRDLAFSLELDDNGDIKTVIDVDAINQSIKNILLTYKGSVPFEDNKGSYLYRKLFDTTIPTQFLESEIKSLIEKELNAQEPLIIITEVIIDLSRINNNILMINIEYDLSDGITSGSFQDIITPNNQFGTPIVQ
jgi:phage baseplate assembly protein W